MSAAPTPKKEKEDLAPSGISKRCTTDLMRTALRSKGVLNCGLDPIMFGFPDPSLFKHFIQLSPYSSIHSNATWLLITRNNILDHKVPIELWPGNSSKSMPLEVCVGINLSGLKSVAGNPPLLDEVILNLITQVPRLRKRILCRLRDFHNLEIEFTPDLPDNTNGWRDYLANLPVPIPEILAPEYYTKILEKLTEWIKSYHLPTDTTEPNPSYTTNPLNPTELYTISIPIRVRLRRVVYVHGEQEQRIEFSLPIPENIRTMGGTAITNYTRDVMLNQLNYEHLHEMGAIPPWNNNFQGLSEDDSSNHHIVPNSFEILNYNPNP